MHGEIVKQPLNYGYSENEEAPETGPLLLCARESKSSHAGSFFFLCTRAFLKLCLAHKSSSSGIPLQSP